MRSLLVFVHLAVISTSALGAALPALASTATDMRGPLAGNEDLEAGVSIHLLNLRLMFTFRLGKELHSPKIKNLIPPTAPINTRKLFRPGRSGLHIFASSFHD
ncbi:hypothetical protein V5O48_012744 [Marasmius crinis-equi]|uniref:Uncharacterized protein n=1 Tax=Marasmius crinis-equi TaxID=585013 RepID=A0ABR3F1Z0_9AGAR